MAPFKAIIHTVWNWINAPLRLAFRLYFAGVFFLVLLLTYPIFKLLIKRGERYTAVFALFKKVSLVIQWLGLVPVKIVKKEHFPDPPFIAIANHASYLDIVHMYSVIPNYFLFLGKSELLHWPIIRIFFKGMNIPVDRKNYKRSMQALMDASDRLKEGKNIVLFPEGGIFDGAPRLKPFRNGAFKLAIKHEVKIVPITFLNNWKYLGDQNPLFGNGRPGISKVIIHPPVSTLGLDLNDVVPLRNECYEVIETPLRNRYPSRFRDSK